MSGCGQSPQISPQDGLGKEARRGGREDSLGRLPSFAAKRAGDEARLVECRVCGGRMMWKILPGEGRVPPVRRHTSPPRWKMYDGSVSRSPARRESFLMGKTPRKKLFPVDRPKSGAPTLKRFCPAGQTASNTYTGSAPCPAGQGSGRKEAAASFPPCEMRACNRMARGGERTANPYFISGGGAACPPVPSPQACKSQTRESLFPNFPISKSPVQQAPPPKSTLNSQVPNFDLPSPKLRNA